MLPSHGLRFADSQFWVMHRRRRYGPFDYEWSKDFCGIELTYAGRKFGEYCSADEIFADLKEFKLPASVVEVSSIVLGCIVYGVLNGLPGPRRMEFLTERLQTMGAYDWFRQAMELYEQAIELRPPGNDDPILRWNTCARVVNRNPSVRPEPEDRMQEMLE